MKTISLLLILLGVFAYNIAEDNVEQASMDFEERIKNTIKQNRDLTDRYTGWAVFILDAENPEVRVDSAFYFQAICEGEVINAGISADATIVAGGEGIESITDLGVGIYGIDLNKENCHVIASPTYNDTHLVAIVRKL